MFDTKQLLKDFLQNGFLPSDGMLSLKGLALGNQFWLTVDLPAGFRRGQTPQALSHQIDKKHSFSGC